MKKVLKVLSIALTVVLVIGIFSCATPVFATEVTEKENLNLALVEYKTQAENSNPKALHEIKEERDKFTKVFKNEDGTKTAIVSATPIHYETSEGWVDIDNTLVEETKITGNTYKNKNNDFTVTIPKELSSNKELQIEKDDYTVSFELEGSDIFSDTKKIKGNKKNKPTNLSNVQNNIDTEFLDKTSGIAFENVGENTSVEYEVTSTGLKENIVLDKKPEEQVVYKYKITAKKLTAELNPDKSVILKNKNGQAVFEIPAPVMYDSENISSKDIEVSLSGKNGKYTLIYKPSFEWLSGDIKYPVVIDPVINTIDEGLGVRDAVADSGNPNDNYGDSTILSTYKSDSGNVQSFVDVSNSYLVKNGAKIKTVLLGLYYLGGLFIDSSTTVAAYTVTSDWSETTLTYNNKPTTVDSLIERKGINQNTNEGYLIFDVTKAYTLKQDTYGVCIRQRDSITSEAQLLFASSEHQTASQQPFFAIQYYETQGVEEQFDYHAFDAGRAGRVYFNDFTEQVYIERDELGLTGINMPVQIKRYFNSGMGGTYSTNYLLYSDIASAYGFGWKTNYTQFIEYHNDIDNEPTILYSNGEGKTTYFNKGSTDSNGITTWNEKPDEFSSSEGYTLYIPQQYENNIKNNFQYVTIKDSAGQIYEFNSDGFLVKINSVEENSTNAINIIYEENDYKIKKIIDGVGREYRFSYTEYEEWLFPLLTSIQAYSPSGTAITVTNDSGTKVPYKMTYTYSFSNYLGTNGLPMLSSATYPDGNTVYYSVSDELISLKNIDGYAVEFAFNETNTVVSEKVYSANGTAFTSGGQLTVTDVNDYEKTFVDINGTTITKQFDMYGRTINTKNNNQTNNSVARIYSEDHKAQGEVTYNFYNTYEQDLTVDETNLITNGSFTTDLSGWTISSSSKVKRTTEYDCVSGTEAPGALQISGARNKSHYASQIIEVENGISGDEYRLDYFVKNTTHSHMVVDLLCLDTILVEARNNVEGDEEWTNVAYVEANPFNTKWQKYSYSFDVDFAYNEIRVIICYFDQYGTVRFDEVSLVNTYKATANQNTDTEGDSGNTGSDDGGSDEIGCECDGCITPNCPCTDCSDNCSIPYCNRGYSFESNSDGTKFSITDGEKTMGMEQNISGNYYSSQFDLNGIYTGYSYDQMNSQLKSMSDGEGQVTSFTYDAMSRLKKVSNDVDGLVSGNKMETSYSYENDRIKSITHNGFSYNYEYDVWGNPTAVKVGEQSLVSYTYDSGNQTRDRINRITYGNGDYTDYSYNADGNIEAIKSYSSDGTLVADYEYGYDNGQVQTITSPSENYAVKYTDYGFEIYNSESAEGTPVYFNGVEIDESGNEVPIEILYGLRYTENEGMIDSDGIDGTTTTSASFQTPNGKTYNLSSVTDYFGRTESKGFSYLLSQENGFNHSIKNNIEYTYRDYEDEENSGEIFTTSQVASYKTSLSEIVSADGDSNNTETVLNSKQYYYEYDSKGNITRISCTDSASDVLPIANEICSFVYDEVGQLVRENDALAELTSVYVYDKGGNLVQRKFYEYSTGTLSEEPYDTWDYTYDDSWKDKLTAFEDFQIETDDMGNPLNYFTNGITNEISGTLEWNGRQLSAVTIGRDRYEYSYNTDGLKTKTVSRDSETNEINTVYNYFWKNGKMTGYCVTDAEGNVAAVLKNFFDNSDEQIGYEVYLVEEDEYIRFFFEKNLQGDIIGVYNEEGQKVLSYWYDAWGNISPIYNDENSNTLVQSVLAVIFTPITYRGYMYDFNTGLYYLQSRYYNPTYGRFLNVDSLMKTGEPLGANIFAYCGNNPVNFVDYDGRDAMSVITNILYLLVVVSIMQNDLGEIFSNLILQGATSFLFKTYTDKNEIVLESYFIHNYGDDFKMYTVYIKIASVEYIDALIKNELISNLENKVNNFEKNTLEGIFLDIVEAGVLTIIESAVGNKEDEALLNKSKFFNKKLEEANENNSQFIVYVDRIIYYYTTIFGNIKYGEVYNCAS